jgi:hypothetical protein
MLEYERPGDGERTQRIAQVALYREWETQISRGYLSRPGLMNLRNRLGLSGEFIAGHDTERMTMIVDAALGALEPPDDLSGLE